MVAPESPLDIEGQSPLQVGQILVGKYRVERQIGRGGMGIVLAATHLQLEHLVAIKVLRRDLLEDDKALSRLFSEARAAAKIRSEHVARVLDVGTLENGSPFIVMEYLDGEDLADLLDRQGALEVTQAVQFLLQSCEALAQVHAAEMVHRDLKPGNLFVAKLADGTPSLKIVDFGISKHIGGSARGLAATTSAQVLGSPYYMPPEQMRAEPVDERSDIWSLGAILFEMLTARPPFLGETLPEVYAGVLSQPAPSVESLRSGIPAGLDDIVQRCLDKDPGQRFCDVADLAEALAPFGGPASAQIVERITRILTNPELFRARASNAPRAPLTAEPPMASGTARGGIAVEPQLVITPSRVIDAVSVGGLSPALVSPAAASAARRTGTASELGPLSATGSLQDLERPSGSRGARAGWAVVTLLTALVVSVLWLRARPEPLLEPPASLPLVPSASPDTPPAERGSVVSTPSASDAPSPVREAGEAERPAPPLQAQTQALKPAPQQIPVISVEGFRAAVAKQATAKVDSDKPSEKKPKGKPAAGRAAVSAPSASSVGQPESEARTPSENAAAGAAASGPGKLRTHDEDPWNPSSFGDRR